MICTSCGNEIGDKSTFCSKCGARVGDGSMNVPMAQPEKQEAGGEYQPPQPDYPQSEYQPPQQDNQQGDYQSPQPGYPQPGYPPPPVYQPPVYQSPQPGYPRQSVYQPPQPGYPQQPVYQSPQPGYQPLPDYGQPPPYPPDALMYQGAPGSFAERVRRFGGSAAFLIGIILYTAGTVTTHVLSWSSMLSIIALALAALPIIGLWLVFSAAKSSGVHGKALPALTLFKVHTIIVLVLVCLIVLLMIIGSIGVMVGIGAVDYVSDYIVMESFTKNILIGVGIAMFIGIAISILIIVLYYRSLLRIIGDTRTGLIYDIMKPLRGAGVFSVLTYIGVGFSIISSIWMMTFTGFANELLYSMPYEFRDIFSNALDVFRQTAYTSAIATLVSSVGIVLCVVVLGRFNRSLTYER